MAAAPRTIRFAHCIMAACGFLLAWMAQRNGILFTFLALPALFWNLPHASAALRGRVAEASKRLLSFAAAALAVGATVNHTRMLCLWPHTLSPFSHPTETARLLAAAPVPGVSLGKEDEIPGPAGPSKYGPSQPGSVNGW